MLYFILTLFPCGFRIWWCVATVTQRQLRNCGSNKNANVVPKPTATRKGDSKCCFAFESFDMRHHMIQASAKSLGVTVPRAGSMPRFSPVVVLIYKFVCKSCLPSTLTSVNRYLRSDNWGNRMTSLPLSNIINVGKCCDVAFVGIENVLANDGFMPMFILAKWSSSVPNLQHA